MKQKIVLNLSNLNGKNRKWVARQVKNNLRALGYQVDATENGDHGHLGFSAGINDDGKNLGVNFDFNNENQAANHLFAGSHVYNEHQLTEFLTEAANLAKNLRPTGTRATEEAEDAKDAGKERVEETVIDGLPVRLCQHGVSIRGTTRELMALILDDKRADAFEKSVIAFAREKGLIDEKVLGFGHSVLV